MAGPASASPSPSPRPAHGTVLIADDHPIVAHGTERLLSHAADFEVVAACHSGRETVEVGGRARPDLVLLDVRLGHLNGSDVCRQLATVAPTTRIVILTAYDDAENLRRCLEAGAAGVLLKGTLDPDLVQALRDVRDGHMVIDGSVARSLETAQGLLDDAHAAHPQLRPREVDMLRLMAARLTTKNIATGLQLPSTPSAATPSPSWRSSAPTQECRLSSSLKSGS